MDTAICPACSAVLPARGFFCPQCLTQARCKSCGEVLEPGAKGCVVCGTPLGEGAATPAVAANGAADHRAPNMLRYEETRTSRKLEANLTDNAVENLAGPINAIMAAGMLGGQRTRRMPMADIIDTDEPLVIQHETIHEAEIISRPIPAQAPVKALESPTPPSGDDRLRALFRQKDGHLYLLGLTQLNVDSRPNRTLFVLNCVSPICMKPA